MYGCCWMLEQKWARERVFIYVLVLVCVCVCICIEFTTKFILSTTKHGAHFMCYIFSLSLSLSLSVSFHLSLSNWCQLLLSSSCSRAPKYMNIKHPCFFAHMILLSHGIARFGLLHRVRVACMLHFCYDCIGKHSSVCVQRMSWVREIAKIKFRGACVATSFSPKPNRTHATWNNKQCEIYTQYTTFFGMHEIFKTQALLNSQMFDLMTFTLAPWHFLPRKHSVCVCSEWGKDGGEIFEIERKCHQIKLPPDLFDNHSKRVNNNRKCHLNTLTSVLK